MFTTFKYRRQVAVLAALAMVASVLVVAPAVAADPEPDFTADFDACIDDAAVSAGFEDVPDNHANAGDIDCIAYYGITRGTSPTTYSPSMSVTREHMALFLTRLAGLVGIEVTSTPADPGFTDTGELSAESQTAINQLADLGITQGTSATTYSPSDSVTRGQMALFISRLMNLMIPVGGKDSEWGHTPSDVAENEDDHEIGSPFGDLGSATKSAYDAITALWELGVASGISDTAYAPSALITRAAMAEFMAGVLDHSNSRPAGLSIQASNPGGFGGTVEADIVVSVRDESFAPVEDQAVDVFSSANPDAITKDGTCAAADDDSLSDTITGDGPCVWSGNDDDLTVASGNIVRTAEPDEGTTVTFYAWIGDEEGAKFDADEVDNVSVAVTAMNQEAAMTTSSDISDKSRTDNTVNLNDRSNVTVTVQLRDNTDDTVAKDVKRSGVPITVRLTQAAGGNTVFDNTNAAQLTTDDDGKASFTVAGPTPDSDDDAQARIDTVAFTYGGNVTTITAAVTYVINWIEVAPELESSDGDAPDYVLSETDDEVSVRGTMTLYDQYGDTFRAVGGSTVTITLGGNPATEVNVKRNGTASLTQDVAVPSNDQITVAYDNGVATVTNPSEDTVWVVTPANAGNSAAEAVGELFKDEDKFRVGSVLYSYDSDDTFLMGSSKITMEMFEEEMGKETAQVHVLIYTTTGASIFIVSHTG
ncbi:MAG: S-layer homology domain-containing protein [bacterium]|nr:S-layer homology domain-containing protein [bacterium]MDE0602748.1 S-layer homology domain-containing protein [bacterium]